MDRLRASLPPARLQRYDLACEGTGVDPMDLYRWSNSIALATFDDISHVEVSMRSSMAQELADRYGMEWYRNTDILDYPTLKLIDKAWAQGRLQDLTVDLPVLHGKLVSSLMFGFWVKILGRGSKYNNDRRVYDTLLWKPALRHAFPGVGDLERKRVQTAARVVQQLRNRVAHHEHIIWGIPLQGDSSSNNSPTRISVLQAHTALLELAGYTNEGLKSWLEENSRVLEIIDQCPIENTGTFLLK